MPRRILLVDDDIAEISAVKRVLARIGFAPVLATNGADALIAVAHDLPEAILVAPATENGAGMEFARKLREEEATAKVPLVLLGEAPGAPERVTALPRPVDPALLVDELRALLKTLPAGDRFEVTAKVANPLAAEQKEAWTAREPAKQPAQPRIVPPAAAPAPATKPAAAPTARPAEARPAAPAAKLTPPGGVAKPAAVAPKPAELKPGPVAQPIARVKLAPVIVPPKAAAPKPAVPEKEPAPQTPGGSAGSAPHSESVKPAGKARSAPGPEGDDRQAAAAATAEADRLAAEAAAKAKAEAERKAAEAEKKAAEAEQKVAEEQKRRREEEEAAAEKEWKAAEAAAVEAAAEEERRVAREKAREAAELAEAEALGRAKALEAELARAKAALEAEKQKREEDAQAAQERAFAEERAAEELRKLAEKETQEKLAAETAAREAAQAETARLAAERAAERAELERRAERAKIEAEARARMEIELAAAREQLARSKLAEEDRKALEEHRRALEEERAAEELRRMAEEEARREAERRAQEEAQLRAAAEAELKRFAATEARAKKAVEEAQKKAEAEARRRAEVEAELSRVASEAQAAAEVERRRADEAAREAREARAAAEESARRRVKELAEKKRSPAAEPAKEREAPAPPRLAVARPPAEEQQHELPEGVKLPLPPPELAEGSLAALPAPRLVALAAQARLTGRLDFTAAVPRSLYFEDGKLAGATSGAAQERVEEVALRLGLVTREQHRQIASAAATLPTRKAAVLLLDRGFMKPTELSALVRRRTEEVLYALFAEKDARFRWAPARAPAEERVALDRGPLALAVEGVRRKWSRERVDEVLGGPGSLLAPAEDAPPLAELGLSGPEQRLYDAADGLRTLDEVLAASELDALSSRQCLAALVLLGALAVKIRAPVEGEPDSPDIDLARVREKLDQVRRADYFAILGVARTCTPYELREAAERLLAELHPNRFAGYGSDGLAKDLAEIGRVVKEARDVLGDDDLRAEYTLGLGE